MSANMGKTSVNYAPVETASKMVIGALCCLDSLHDVSSSAKTLVFWLGLDV